MDHIALGKTGLKVSRLCLGMMTYGSKNWRQWVLNEEESQPIIKRAIELGFTFFDTANVYSLGVSEEILGRALKTYAVQREQVVVATKVFNAMGDTPNERGLSRKHIMDQIDASLQRLGMDYVDLYQIHRFDPDNADRGDDRRARRRGAGRQGALYRRVVDVCVAIRAAISTRPISMGKARFVAMQNHYNLVYREEEREMIPLCRAEGIGIIPWSPMARGFLMGNRGRGKGEAETIRPRPTSSAMASIIATTTTRWSTRSPRSPRSAACPMPRSRWPGFSHQPGITAPIIGASKLAHLDDAVKALGLQARRRGIDQAVGAVSSPPGARTQLDLIFTAARCVQRLGHQA